MNKIEPRWLQIFRMICGLLDFYQRLCQGNFGWYCQYGRKRNQYLTVIYQKSQVMEKLLEKLFAFHNCRQIKCHLIKSSLIWLSFTVLCKRETEELVDEDIRFSLEVSDGLPVEIDPIQFRRILDNLVDNARKYAAVKP